MSVVASTPTQICNHPVNNSKAKQLWSFSKSSKDGTIRKSDCTQAFYDLPSVRQTRTATFGFGHKYDFTKAATTNPPPNAYDIPTNFVKSPKKGFSFGLSRETMASTGSQFIGEKQSPGPGAYDVREKMKSVLSYSFRPRNETEVLTSPKFVPGPGSYPVFVATSPKGKYPISNFKGSGATLFSPVRSKRFYDLKPGFPGPGTYTPIAATKEDGSYFVSKFRSSLCRTFSKGIRKNASMIKFGPETPGPGSYRIPSDFGYYEAGKSAIGNRTMSNFHINNNTVDQDKTVDAHNKTVEG
jgi:hypothetical protein